MISGNNYLRERFIKMWNQFSVRGNILYILILDVSHIFHNVNLPRAKNVVPPSPRTRAHSPLIQSQRDLVLRLDRAVLVDRRIFDCSSHLLAPS